MKRIKQEKLDSDCSRRTVPAAHRALAVAEDLSILLLLASVALCFSTELLANFTLPKLLALRACTLLLALVWVFRILRRENLSIPPWVLLSGAALGVWWLGTTFFSLHKPTALHGVYGRYNGLITHSNWLFLFFVLASLPIGTARLHRILKCFVAILVSVAVYALLQFLGVDFIPWDLLQGRSHSTIGHPVLLCAVLGLAIPFVIYFFFRACSASRRFLWGGIFILFFCAAISTLSRGPLIAMILASSAVAIVHLRQSTTHTKWFLGGVAGLLTLACVFIVVRGGADQIFNRLKSGREVSVRFLYYKTALSMIREYPVTGVGFESFRLVYPRHRLAEETALVRDVIPTMVHNGYLQLAVTNGLPALGLWVVFLGSIGWPLAKAGRFAKDRGDRLLLVAFMASLVGFLVQDLSGWLDISQTTFFWVLLGLSIPVCRIRGGGLQQRAAHRKVALICGLAGVGAFLYLTGEALERIQANRLFWKARLAGEARAWKDMEICLADGLDRVGDDFHYQDMAGTMFIEYFAHTGQHETYARARDLLDAAHMNNPYDAYVLIHRVELETLALRRGVIKKTAPSVEPAIRSLLFWDENNPTIYEAVVKLRLAENRASETLPQLAKLERLGGDRRKYFLLKADVYRQLGDCTTAMDAYSSTIGLPETASASQAEWTQAVYGRIGCLMQTGQTELAIGEVDAVLARYPQTASAYLVLGDIYFWLKEIEKARDAYAAALRIEPGNRGALGNLQECKRILRMGRPD